MSNTMLTAGCAAFFLLIAGTVAAKPPLKDVEEISEGIIAAGMAFEIGRSCDGLSARILRGAGYLRELKARAAALGYSSDEIKAYVGNDQEKKRLETIARERLKGLGATPGNSASHCEIGRAQKAQGTTVGWLLR